MDEVEAVRAQLRAVREELTAVRFRLLGLQTALGPAAEAEYDEADPASRMHSAIGCGLRDRLDPLIQDLDAAAEEDAGSRGTVPT
jgi:hypothetical protein